MAQHHGAVLLLAFGGPSSSEEVRPFLARVLQGRAVPLERVEEVVRHYEAVGGRSPLKEITIRQATALQKRLEADHLELPVYVGLRHSTPYVRDALAGMTKDGVKRVLGFILSTHQTEASWERYRKDVAEARSDLANPPEVDFCPGWHDHPLLIQALAELIGPVLGAVDAGKKPQTPLIFTAHSIPEAMAARSLYEKQLLETSRLVANRLNHPRWSLAYQSRSGQPSEAWLGPDISEALRAMAAQGTPDIVVAPIGFVCDHVEVLYDLDIEARKIAEGLGMRFWRAPSLNDHPTFIRMMAEIIADHVRDSRA